MAKRNRINIHRGNEENYNLIPHGNAYKPFILIQDVPSLGRSSRLRGIKTGRQHEFLSDLERNYFILLEFSAFVVDIREQFPLELKETLLIAEELGIKHPIHPITKKPITMTSDFCITLKKGDTTEDIIRTTKYKQDLLSRRVIEKFQIEKTYWHRKEINWGIVTEVEIDKIYSQNIADALAYYDLSDYAGLSDIDEDEKEDLVIEFLKRLLVSDKTVRQISRMFEQDVHLPKGAGIALFKHLIAQKYITIDLLQPLNIDQYIRVELLKKSRMLGMGIS
ncbi:TnsA endonuclease N-terminal domain-containing protein [Pectinatus brassicae]|uniref:TnsA endonuclease n=1 Tax=Pectinatus brassicae TaxID=862415 RepID=A0A840UJB7_9FIRM|nr:TnsA endonuclease N-terminal domain-containing protein [Pectinatus brassicae]MBB5335737.1 hypothetical protein [Pectinatus brassicae]